MTSMLDNLSCYSIVILNLTYFLPIYLGLVYFIKFYNYWINFIITKIIMNHLNWHVYYNTIVKLVALILLKGIYY